MTLMITGLSDATPSVASCISLVLKSRPLAASTAVVVPLWRNLYDLWSHKPLHLPGCPVTCLLLKAPLVHFCSLSQLGVVRTGPTAQHCSSLSSVIPWIWRCDSGISLMVSGPTPILRFQSLELASFSILCLGNLVITTNLDQSIDSASSSSTGFWRFFQTLTELACDVSRASLPWHCR